ncbi:MAG TPA: preprotein translocase subunit SecG [Chitinivibrionales bacterium]|nr:preprotein translocase subunit SecG [Chitinivibrionales bacterium]
MSWIFGILIALFVIVCVFLCMIILIQSDKGGGISGTLGGGFSSATSLLGAGDTANILTRATAISAGIFLGLCLIMSIFVSHPSQSQIKSALKERAEKQGSYSPSSVLQGQQGLPVGNQGQGEAGPQGMPVPQGLPQGATPKAPGPTTQPAPALPAPAPSRGKGK